MSKAQVSRRILDTLIRAKLATLEHCESVQPMPVVARERGSHESNWTISGWNGKAEAVEKCAGQMAGYIRYLHDQFDIAPESAS